MNPYINAAFFGPRLASYAPEEPLTSQAPPVMIGPPAPPPMIGPPAPPSVVVSAPAAPPPVVVPGQIMTPRVQASVAPPMQVASVQPPPQPTTDPSGRPDGVSVGVAMSPLQYRMIATAGRKEGELNTMGPNQERLYTQAAQGEGGAAQYAAAETAMAMQAQQMPLDERAKYLTAMAQREARDQTGRNEENRQRLEDYERETKELRAMKVDPDQAVSSTQQAIHGGGTFMATLFDALSASRGVKGNAVNIVGDSYKNRQAMGMRAQEQNIGNRRAYIEAALRGAQMQREMQADQSASNARAAALMGQASAAKFDQAGIGVNQAETLGKGDTSKMKYMADVLRAKAGKQVYVPASGGGRKYLVKDDATGAMMEMDAKEFNAHVKDVGKGIRETSQKIAIDGAHAENEGKAKRAENVEQRFVPRAGGGGYLAATPEEAKAHREADLASAQFKQTVQEMKVLRNKLDAFDVSGISTEDARRIKSLQAQAAVSFGKMKGLGTYDSGMEKLAEQIFGDPTGFRSPVANYDVLIDRIDADADARARSPQGAMRQNLKDAAPSAERVK